MTFCRHWCRQVQFLSNWEKMQKSKNILSETFNFKMAPSTSLWGQCKTYRGHNESPLPSLKKFYNLHNQDPPPPDTGNGICVQYRWSLSNLQLYTIQLYAHISISHPKWINTKVEQTKATTTGWAIRFYLVWK